MLVASSRGLPLLARELLAQSARARTYQVRVAYAAVLLLICFWVLVWNTPSSQVATVSGLGVGRPVLATLTVLQELGLFLVLPVLACGTLTVEKERRTLDLLLITRLGPWAIIFEKFLSRLIPALNFILLSLPILAFSYALGGLTSERISISLLELILTAIRLTALGIVCSAAARTTGQALVATYAMITLTCIVEQSVQLALIPLYNITMRPAVALVEPDMARLMANEPGLLSLLRSPLVLSSAQDLALWQRILWGGLPSLALSLLFLPAARWLAIPPTQGWIADLYRLPLRFAWSARQAPRLEGEPANDPIAWRESPRGDLAWWWVKNCCLTGIPMLVLMLSVTVPYDKQDARIMSVTVYFVVWLAVAMRISSRAACVVVQERIQQTLEILLCTPLTAHDIIEQKMSAISRTVQISRIPLIVCLAVKSMIHFDLFYLILSGLMVWFYPKLIAWQSAAAGLRSKTSGEAILKAFLSLLVWYLGPYLVCFLFALMMVGGGADEGFFLFIASASPLTMLGATEIIHANEHRHFQERDWGMFILMVLTTVVFQGVRLGYLFDWVTRQSRSILFGISDEVLERRLRESDSWASGGGTS